jgi:hypothetical protein
MFLVLHSYEINSPFNTSLDLYKVSDNKKFCINLTLHLGLKDSEDSELFYLKVYSIDKWNEISKKPKWGYLVIKNYNPKEILERIDNILKKGEGKNYEEVCIKLCKYLSWEYEDYPKETQKDIERIEKIKSIRER